MVQTKEWYSTHGMMDKFNKLYKCGGCKYKLYCTNVDTEHISKCKDLYGGDSDFDPSSIWGEMSWHREQAAENRSMQQRLRDGE
jgi:hypothetical protein